MRVHLESCFNFNKKHLRGCNIEVLPFLRVFPPQRQRRSFIGSGYGKGWTFHFGWLYWTVMVFTYPDYKSWSKAA